MKKSLCFLLIISLVSLSSFSFSGSMYFISDVLGNITTSIETVKGIIGSGVINGPVNMETLLKRTFYNNAADEYCSVGDWLSFKMKSENIIIGEENLKIVAVNELIYSVTIRNNDENFAKKRAFDAIRLTIEYDEERYDCFWIDPDGSYSFNPCKFIWEDTVYNITVKTSIYEFRAEYHIQPVFSSDQLDNYNLFQVSLKYGKIPESIVSTKQNIVSYLENWTGG